MNLAGDLTKSFEIVSKHSGGYVTRSTWMVELHGRGNCRVACPSGGSGPRTLARSEIIHLLWILEEGGGRRLGGRQAYKTMQEKVH